MSRGSEALDQAYREIPQAWYEGHSINKLRLLMAGAGIGTISVYMSSDELRELINHHPIVSGIIGAALYSISALADNRSTVTMYNATDEARNVGIPILHYEDGPALSHIKTAAEFRQSKIRKAQDLIFAGISAVSPVVSVPLAGMKFFASANNRRIARRYLRAAEIARQG